MLWYSDVFLFSRLLQNKNASVVDVIVDYVNLFISGFLDKLLNGNSKKKPEYFSINVRNIDFIEFR